MSTDADTDAQQPAESPPDEATANGEPSTETKPNDEPSPETGDGVGTRNVLQYLEWAGLGLCILLVVVAGLRVYAGVGAFISLWIEPRYEPLVSAGFNLAVLLVAAYGAAILSRRVTATR